MSHDCSIDEPPARVFVDGVQIPVINDGITTEIRKREAASITRHSEVYFPVEWNGTDYLSAVNALDPTEPNVYDPVDVRLRDETTGEYVTAHRGFVMGVGGGAHGSLEHRMTVGDPGQLLNAITFERSYTDITSPAEILDEALDLVEGILTPQIFSRMERSLRVPGVNTDDTESEAETGDPTTVDGFTTNIDQAYTGLLGPLNPLGGGGDTKYEYIRKKDTVADVLDDLQESLGVIFYFEPSGDDDAMRFVLDAGITERTHVANHVDEVGIYEAPNNDIGVINETFGGDFDISVYRNNALHEIRPVNEILVQGERSDGSYPQVRATHLPLQRRTQTPLRVPIQQAKTTNMDELEEIAVQRLKEEIDAGSMGRILTGTAPYARPFDRVIAQPSCGSNISRQTPPFQYEIERMTHRIAAQDNDDSVRKHETQLSVNVFVDTDDIVTQRDYIDTGESGVSAAAEEYSDATLTVDKYTK